MQGVSPEVYSEAVNLIGLRRKRHDAAAALERDKQVALADACAQAIAAGVPKSDVALHAGISRPTLDKWLAALPSDGGD